MIPEYQEEAMVLRSSTLTDQIVEAIRDDITSGRLDPSALYSVQSLAEQLTLTGGGDRVSRTPVREALVRLAEAGMVRFVRNRGIQIVRPEVGDLEEIFQLRLMLEPPAAFNAAMRADAELLQELETELTGMGEAARAENLAKFMQHDVAFHQRVLRAGGNKRLVAIVRNLRDVTGTLGWDILLAQAVGEPAEGAGLEAVMAAHAPVLTALREGDPEGARRAMHRHVEQTGQMLIDQLSRNSQLDRPVGVRWAESIIRPT